MNQALRNELLQNWVLYYKFVYDFVHRREDTEDILQNVYCKLQNANFIPQFDSAPQVWLHRVCRHEAYNFLRKHKHEFPVGDDAFFDIQYAPQGDPPFMLLDALNYALSLAPQQVRQPLYRRFLYGKSILALQRIYGIPESTLRYWKKRCLEILKKELY